MDTMIRGTLLLLENCGIPNGQLRKNGVGVGSLQCGQPFDEHQRSKAKHAHQC